jgi:hypothetical protein
MSVDAADVRSPTRMCLQLDELSGDVGWLEGQPVPCRSSRDRSLLAF